MMQSGLTIRRGGCIEASHCFARGSKSRLQPSIDTVYLNVVGKLWPWADTDIGELKTGVTQVRITADSDEDTEQVYF